jgi:hypothetical protein
MSCVLCVLSADGAGPAAAAAEDLRLWLQQSTLHECTKVQGEGSRDIQQACGGCMGHWQQQKLRSPAVALSTCFAAIAGSVDTAGIMHRLQARTRGIQLLGAPVCHTT